MRKCMAVLLVLILALSVCGCSSGGATVEKDEHNRVVKIVYRDSKGKVKEEKTYTYYDNDMMRTEKSVYPQVKDDSTPNKVEIEYSEDGNTTLTKTYYEDRLAKEVYFELYANSDDNWHLSYDFATWCRHSIKTYYVDGTIVHTGFEYLDDGQTLAERSYRPDGTLMKESFYHWCDEHNYWDEKVKEISYDENGNPIE